MAYKAFNSFEKLSFLLIICLTLANIEMATLQYNCRYIHCALMKKEMASHQENNTWTPVYLTEGKKVVKVRWVYRLKTEDDKKRYKVRRWYYRDVTNSDF